MTRHPWVAEADGGVRFGLLIPGGRRYAPGQGLVCPDDPVPIFLRAGRLAEDLGFDAVFCGDYSWVLPDPFVYLAALAAVTHRLRLGVLVVSVFLRHPSYLGRLVADLDAVSGGRFIVGIGIGESEDQVRSVGMPWGSQAERQKALDEALQIVQGVWGDDVYAYQGEHFRTARARVIPPPTARLPIIVGGGGRRTLGQVARHGDACNFGGTWDAITPEEVHQRLEVLREQCRVAGRPYDEILRTHLSLLVIAPTERRLEAKLARYFRPESAEDMQKIGWLVAGTPKRVAEYFVARAEAGMQYFVSHLADTADEETMALLAEDVLPTVRGPTT